MPLLQTLAAVHSEWLAEQGLCTATSSRRRVRKGVLKVRLLGARNVWAKARAATAQPSRAVRDEPC
jgi:hypothetical protein